MITCVNCLIIGASFKRSLHTESFFISKKMISASQRESLNLSIRFLKTIKRYSVHLLRAAKIKKTLSASALNYSVKKRSYNT